MLRAAALLSVSPARCSFDPRSRAPGSYRAVNKRFLSTGETGEFASGNAGFGLNLGVAPGAPQDLSSNRREDDGSQKLRNVADTSEVDGECCCQQNSYLELGWKMQWLPKILVLQPSARPSSYCAERASRVLSKSRLSASPERIRGLRFRALREVCNGIQRSQSIPVCSVDPKQRIEPRPRVPPRRNLRPSYSSGEM